MPVRIHYLPPVWHVVPQDASTSHLINISTIKISIISVFKTSTSVCVTSWVVFEMPNVGLK